MAATASPQKRAISLKVITETSATGTKYATVSLGKVSTSLNVSANATAIYNIADALAICLGNTVGYVQAVSTDRIVDDE